MDFHGFHMNLKLKAITLSLKEKQKTAHLQNCCKAQVEESTGTIPKTRGILHLLPVQQQHENM